MSVPYGILISGLGEYIDEYLSPLLTSAGYYVQLARGSAVLFDTLNRQTDLALIDLPGKDHLDLLNALRTHYTGMLVVLGPRHDWLVVTAFAQGVDDYVTRPFRADELMARVRAQLRRRQRYAPPPFTLGPFVFDLATRTISYQGHPLALDLPSFTLLSVLAEAPYRTFTPEELLESVWGRGQTHNLPLLAATWQSLCQQMPSREATKVLVGNPHCGLALLQS
ncbi:response regulator transcription factor [uncultured Chloroflexus sp.]|uniref:response regulator transcription factor n=1 Tax=uncultured Chloroflexus sp. TaxID=214040 RepID=UPI0026226F70|nr:response regulator transcription factor [uncultured Chloroflexus sp.]